MPKPLWERRIAPDARNRIPLALRCLLIETPDALVLIDDGAGNKESDRFIDIYGLENSPSAPPAGVAWPTRLEEALAALGHGPEDIGIVIDTHLHFDHAGGNTYRDVDGVVRLSFPRARYVVQAGEWEWAHSRNERVRASYLPDNFDPVHAAGRFELVSGEHEVIPGVRVVPTPGHTPHHQSVVLSSGGETACFLADLVPTAAHLPLPWIMGYDLEPLRTLESKRSVLEEAVARGWWLIFEHDPVTALARLERTSKGLELRDVVPAPRRERQAAN